MGGSGLPCPDGQPALVGTLLTPQPTPPHPPPPPRPRWEASPIPSPAWLHGECLPRPRLPAEETSNVCPCHEIGGCAVGPWTPARPPRQTAVVAWAVGSRGRRLGPPGSSVVGGWPAWSPHRPLWAPSPHLGGCLPSEPSVLCPSRRAVPSPWLFPVQRWACSCPQE